MVAGVEQGGGQGVDAVDAAQGADDGQGGGDRLAQVLGGEGDDGVPDVVVSCLLADAGMVGGQGIHEALNDVVKVGVGRIGVGNEVNSGVIVNGGHGKAFSHSHCVQQHRSNWFAYRNLGGAGGRSRAPNRGPSRRTADE